MNNEVSGKHTLISDFVALVMPDISTRIIAIYHALILRRRQNRQCRMASIINDLEHLTGLTLFPSGCIINAFILRFESVGCDDVL